MHLENHHQKDQLIICVDDEKIILDALKKELQATLPAHYKIELAESGDEALYLLVEYLAEGYDIPLIITDYIMPNMRGDELLKQVSLLSPTTFGILLTGQADLDGVRNSIRYARLQSFILKPWDMIDLVGDVQKTLSIYNKEQQINYQNAVLRDLNLHLEEKVKRKTQELVQKNEQLAELNREKDNLLSIVAHDLGAPLNNIFGLLGLIQEELVFTEEQAAYLQLIYQEIDKGKKHIDELLAICNYESWKAKSLVVCELNMHNFLKRITSQFEGVAQKKEITIDCQDIPEDLVLETDEDLLTRIMQNLFSNAVKFSNPQTNIKISVQKEGDQVQIGIRDEGLGFSEEDKQKIFQKFQKLSARPTSGESSTGLGLSIVKSFTERLGGKIHLESCLGEGSTFRLSFPQKIAVKI
ncbi:MAG: hybrid sensor histidine kinase/response regulator [Bacteroidetes bacterium]|nr:MAG: hybrid sensor histidine kinase/response regulator [Bacteroidota bacterium]